MIREKIFAARTLIYEKWGIRVTTPSWQSMKTGAVDLATGLVALLSFGSVLPSWPLDYIIRRHNRDS